MPEWIMQVRGPAPSNNTNIAELPFRNLQGEWFLSKPDQIRFEVPLYHPVVTYPGKMYPGRDEIWLFRNGVNVFSGPLWDMVASSQSGAWNCSAMGLESYLDRRRVNADTTISGDVIGSMWDLIDASQLETGGDLNFVASGTLPTGYSVTAKFLRREHRTIYDIIDDYAKQDPGFDWEILSSNRTFNAWAGARNDTAPGYLSFDGTNGSGNMKSYALQIMGKYMANDILIANQTTFKTSVGTASRSKYGLRQYGETMSDTPTALLQTRASRVRLLRQSPKLVPSVVTDGQEFNPFLVHVWMGDSIKVTIDDPPIFYDQTMRCIGFQCSVNKHGYETFVIYLNDLREVDPGYDP
jgi:hypothetical protein